MDKTKNLYVIVLTLSILSAAFGLVGFIAFFIAQVVANSPNQPVPFSIIAGGNKQIDYPGDSCANIELNNFSPNIPTVAYLTTDISIVTTKKLKHILVDHSLQVGYDPNQLTYYGVPVSQDDKVNLYIRASSINPDIQSANVFVYEVKGFDQFLHHTNTNTNPIFTSSLVPLCLQLASGCTINWIVRSEGWLYFVFETTPSPSTLVVNLEATVSNYDPGSIYDMCTLNTRSPRCFLEVPTQIGRTETTINGRTGYYKTVEYLPFSITYTTANLTSSPASSQSLSLSVDLSSECTYNYLSFIPISMALFIILFLASTACSVLVIVYKCHSIYGSRGTSGNTRTAAANLQLETTTHQNPSVRSEPLPPTYKDIARKHAEDQLPSYTSCS